MNSMLSEYSAILNHIGKLNFRTSCMIAILVDVALGAFFWNMLIRLDLVPFLNHLSNLISQIDEIISWLTSNPVGLKLNEPVNLALASFFRYHIYLWHTFVQFLYAPVLLKAVTYSFLIGFSFALGILTDLISIFTLHIHCFDVYASRLASVAWYSLCSLWRALRGKKWNPLRSRVDTVHLDSREQFLSTLLFSLLLFLLPTIFVYFIVFKTLRLAVFCCRQVFFQLSRTYLLLETAASRILKTAGCHSSDPC